MILLHGLYPLVLYLLVPNPLSLCPLQVITPLLGKHNVYNVLAAVAVGISLNINLKVPHTLDPAQLPAFLYPR